MKNELLKFLSVHCRSNQTIILGFSGGCDSTALLHLLLEVKEHFPLNIHLAHIDHRMRAESSLQAKELQEIAFVKNLPFHLHTLESSPSSNLEDYYRMQRLKFFHKLYIQLNADGLFLAHHGDDLSETCLKRLFEGANLSKWYGMQPYTKLLGMDVYRPLLDVRKKDLQDYLESQDIPYIHDYTNEDPRYCRGAFRTKIVPDVQKHFGKSIIKNIINFSKTSKELCEYLNDRLKPITNEVIKGPYGTYLDLRNKHIHPFEMRYLIIHLAQDLGISLTKQMTNTLVQLISDQAINKKIIVHPYEIIVDRGRIFFFNCSKPFFEIEQGPFNLIGWKNIWQNAHIITVPSNEYELQPPDLSMRCINGKRLKQWYSENKVPAFLRTFIPIVSKEGVVHHELLTGKRLNFVNREKIIVDV